MGQRQRFEGPKLGRVGEGAGDERRPGGRNEQMDMQRTHSETLKVYFCRAWYEQRNVELAAVPSVGDVDQNSRRFRSGPRRDDHRSIGAFGRSVMVCLSAHFPNL